MSGPCCVSARSPSPTLRRPTASDSLAAKLYGETVGRIYTQASTGAEIMMLLAHGDTQSNDLQLHRPEVCYPAFGFAISNSTAIPTSFPRHSRPPQERNRPLMVSKSSRLLR